MLAFLVGLAAAQITCLPGTFYYVQNGNERCIQCVAGCACPGNITACYGCHSGTYSAGKASTACTPCPPGTTSNIIINAGCDPNSYTAPCSNAYGPLGETECRPIPPPQIVAFVAPDGGLSLPDQYLTTTAPFIPNKVPPFYDVEGFPMLTPIQP